jgi:PIN domain nuclease of toxin-antitoxin system
MLASLPPHHHDPFDRLLVAQAQTEQLAVLTADRQLERYEVSVKQA